MVNCATIELRHVALDLTAIAVLARRGIVRALDDHDLPVVLQGHDIEVEDLHALASLKAIEVDVIVGGADLRLRLSGEAYTERLKALAAIDHDRLLADVRAGVRT